MGFFGASHKWGGKNNVAQVTLIMLYMQYCDQKNIFAKRYVQNWPENVFVIKSVKNTVTRTYLKNDLDSEEIVASFYEKELNEKQIKNSLQSPGKKMLELYINWKSYFKFF